MNITIGTDVALSPGAIAQGAKIVQRSKVDTEHSGERVYWDEAVNVSGLLARTIKQSGFCGRRLTLYHVKGETLDIGDHILEQPNEASLLETYKPQIAIIIEGGVVIGARALNGNSEMSYVIVDVDEIKENGEFDEERSVHVVDGCMDADADEFTELALDLDTQW